MMTEPSPRLAGALANRYRLERELGHGGMATVYLAADLKHDRKVAIKVLKPELAAVLGAERFVQEIKTTAALSHPHILPLFDSGEADGFLFYVMPFVDGETLRSKLDRETQFGVDEAVKLASEVADALHYAHEHGVIHRDIKPENILLANGRPMVADFGIALALSAAAGGRMTETGLSLGTPHYMSPEQATAEKEISARSDVYSLASVLYEMLTGNPPHVGSSAQQIIMKIITEQPQPVTQLRKSVPNNVAAAVAKALEKLPADRFDSASKFAEALANPVFTVHSATSSTIQRANDSRWKWLAIGTSIVALGATAVAVMTSKRNTGSAGSLPVVRFELSGARNQRIVTGVSAPFGVTPDGRTIVYSASDSTGVISLFVRSLDDPVPRRLPGTEDGTHPAISPDGQWVAYIAGNRMLSKLRLTGGAPSVLTELPGASASLSWLSDDELIAEIIAPSAEMRRVSANGGASVIAVPFDSSVNEQRQRRPLVLRESQMLLYAATLSNDSIAIVMYSLRDGRRARLAIEGAPLAVIDDLLVYATSGTLRAVAIDVQAMKTIGEPVQLSQRAGRHTTGTAAAVSEAGTLVYEDHAVAATSRLELVNFAGARTPLRANDQYSAPRFSPDGRRIAVAIGTGSTSLGIAAASDIWVIDIATREAVRVTNTGVAESPEWSPDGMRLYYVKRGGQRNGVWLTALDGSTVPTRVVENDGEVVSAVPTPDHQSMIMSRWGKGDARLELLRITLAAPARVDTLVSPRGPNDVRPITPRVSPDGRLVAFADRTQRSVHVRVLEGQGALQISTSGGCCPLWAPNSRRVYFRDNDKLVAVDVNVSPSLSVANRTISDGFWVTGTNMFNVYDDMHYDLSPDGRTFVVVTPVNATTKVFVAVNWAEELRKEFNAGARK